jgi:hypothetical protein
MVLTSFPSETGSGKVRVKILAGTFCAPFGHVDEGQVLTLDHAEYLALKHAHKAVLAPPDDPPVAAPDPEPKPKSKGVPKQ